MQMNGHGSIESLSEKAYEIAKRRQGAANEVVNMLEDQYETTFGSHASSVLHAAAWLAGISLRRSFGSDGESSPEAASGADGSNEELKLMKVFMFLVDKNGIQLNPEDYAKDVPEEQGPHITIVETEQKFGSRFDEIMEQHGFDHADGARTGAVVCARLVKLHCVNRNDIAPEIAASIVAKGFVEGADEGSAGGTSES